MTSFFLRKQNEPVDTSPKKPAYFHYLFRLILLRRVVGSACVMIIGKTKQLIHVSVYIHRDIKHTAISESE